MIALAALLTRYVGSYLYLSRRGMAEAREYQLPKYCFSSPANGGSEERHMKLYRLYLPLVNLERVFGTSSMEPGSWPFGMTDP
jgi:hypothetical protein